MKKKWMLAALTAALAAGVLAGCGAENNTTSSNTAIGSAVSSGAADSVGSEVVSETESETPSEPESSGASSAASSRPAGNNASAKTPQEVVKAIAAAYGEDYLPDSELSEEMIYGYFNVDKSLVESVYGETPMISVNPDEVFVMKAVKGKGAALEEALQKARDEYVENAMVYPKDMAKLNASRVVRNGDYVAFLMLGAVDEVSETDEAALKFAQDEIEKGVDAFNAALK